MTQIVSLCIDLLFVHLYCHDQIMDYGGLCVV
uniref:Uncharacterized protein n=1 Tax=Arundo donax TaxID=35708 RepID=A0A0A8XYI8_ARUDO